MTDNDNLDNSENFSFSKNDTDLNKEYNDWWLYIFVLSFKNYIFK